MSRPVALTIAGSDSGGGAGIVADLKTFEAHDVWGAVAVTAVTAQNTLGVQATEAVSPLLVRAQIASVAADFDVAAAKTGMLAEVETVEVVAATVAELGVGPLVVDPILVSSSGDRLLDPAALDVLREQLLPVATVVTPNVPEAAALTGRSVDDRRSMEDVARALAALGPDVVVVTGGHLDGDGVADCIVAGDRVQWLTGDRILTRHTHGTGCVFSATVCAELARGMDAVDACIAAKHFVEKAVAGAVEIGSGTGPVDPGWERRVS